MGLRIVDKAGGTDVGRQRNTNEDAYLEAAPVFAVADGMGGARAGEVASRIAVEAFDDTAAPAGGLEERLTTIARDANRKIHELSRSDEARAGMGTTLTAAMVGQNEVAIGHVGDSRAYRLRDGELEQVTTDHSLVEELVRQGRLTPEEAEAHPQRSVITRALGPEPEVSVDTCTYRARDGDVYLLCSDGLTGMVPDDELADILRSSSSLGQAKDRLIDAANGRGGRDNITVVLFRLAADADAEDDADTLSGSETADGLDADAVRAAVAASDTSAGDSTVVRAPRRGRRPAAPGGAPARRRGERSPAGRAKAAPAGPKAAPQAVGAGPRTRRPSAAAPGAVPRASKRPRVPWGAAVAALLVAGALVAGFYGSRQVYFLGTDDHGLITLYRGLPYDLPLGLALYTTEFTSTVPAASIAKLQRDRVLDHELRGRGDAVDLIRQLERAERGP